MSKTIVFSPEEISIFCDQIAMILNGGILYMRVPTFSMKKWMKVRLRMY